MDFTLFWQSLLLGLVEGFTEFLPVSSTGHLILAADLVGFEGEKAKLFEIVIQSGAILAVCWEYRAKLASVLMGLSTRPESQRFVWNLFVAFLPLALLGLLLQKPIKAMLFHPVPVALAFVVGGLFILWAERREHTVRITSVDQLRTSDALKLGLCQALALIPGTSRSGATIIGGLFLGLSRPAATEFSFFLAMPTLIMATLYSLWKERALLHGGDLGMWATGFIAAFVSAFLCVRWLLRFVSRHSFEVFAWYRIAFGAVVLLTAYFGWVNWVD